jgi:hypothetical protein
VGRPVSLERTNRRQLPCGLTVRVVNNDASLPRSGSQALEPFVRRQFAFTISSSSLPRPSPSSPPRSSRRCSYGVGEPVERITTACPDSGRSTSSSRLPIAYESGTDWSSFFLTACNIIGPLIGCEVLTPFCLELTFFPRISRSLPRTAGCRQPPPGTSCTAESRTRWLGCRDLQSQLSISFHVPYMTTSVVESAWTEYV